jgi:glycolate oxidase FAD binding subunit
MSKVTLYEPSALTIVAQAGTPLDDIQAALEAEGQMLPFEPMDHQAILGVQGAPTIGGAAACNISGPRRIQGIACRDSMIGVRFVDGAGTVLKNGGRVMKNVTGYDLVKLMAGSLGTLGVMTEVALKVLPKPEACGVVLINGLSDTQAIQALSQALGSPFDVSGVAHVPVGVDGHPVTMVRVEGLGRSVTYRSDALAKLLSPFGETLVELDPDRTSSGWKWVRNVSAFDGLEGDIWRLSVKPSDGPDVVAKLAPLRTVYDWGGGLVWVLMPVGSDVRKHLVQGHATLIRGSDETKSARGVFHPEPGPLARISEGLREKFDPRGILNTGIMG